MLPFVWFVSSVFLRLERSFPQELLGNGKVLAGSCSLGFSGLAKWLCPGGCLFFWLQQWLRRQQRSYGGFEFYTMHLFYRYGVRHRTPATENCRWHVLPPSLCEGNSEESDLCKHWCAVSSWQCHLRTGQQWDWAVDTLLIDSPTLPPRSVADLGTTVTF